MMVAPTALQNLVEKARAGDRQAFDEIVERCQDRLTATVRSRLRVHSETGLEVADVVQETFARAFESIARFKWQEDAAFHGWLSGIAERVILEAAREQRKGPKLQLEPDVPGRGASPSRVARREERFDRLERALNRLSPDYREAVFLSRIERLKVKEIAERMGRSPEAVRQLLSRALKKMKVEFGDTESLNLPDRCFRAEGDENAGP